MFCYKNKQIIQIIQLLLCSILIFASTFYFLSFDFISKAQASEITKEKLLDLTNQTRKSYGVKPLLMDPLLYQAAQSKAQDMIQNHYFEHYTPDGKSPWSFIQEAGYRYRYAAENLAMDFRTAEGIHNAWMNSPVHRQNILNPQYKDIGIAVVKGEIDNHQTTLVVQMFGQKDKTLLGKINFLAFKITSFLLGQDVFQKISLTD